jgi:phage baseplate assembly protein gpV
MNELAELLRASAAQATRGLNTCMPGRVVSYDAGSQRASVQPLLKMRQPDGTEEDTPILNMVPVIWPRSGGASITLPVRSGDGCLVLFCQRSIDEFKSSGDVTIPQDPRQFDLSDAVAIMGFVSFGAAGGSEDSIELKFGSTTINIKEDSVEVEGPSITIKGPTKIEGNLELEGNFTVTGGGGGAVNINSPGLFHNSKNIGENHTHSGVVPGGGNTGVPV